MKVQKRVPFSEICQKLNLFKLNPRSSIFWCWSSLLVGLSRTLDFWEGRLADLSKTWEKLLLDSLLVISHSPTHSISLWSFFQGELSAQGSKSLTRDKHFQTVGSYNYHHEKHTAILILYLILVHVICNTWWITQNFQFQYIRKHTLIWEKSWRTLLSFNFCLHSWSWKTNMRRLLLFYWLYDCVVCLKGWLSPQYGFSDSLLQRIHSRNSTAWFAKFSCSNQLLQAWINPKWQQIENPCYIIAAIKLYISCMPPFRHCWQTKIWGNIPAQKYDGVFQHKNMRGYSSMKILGGVPAWKLIK